MTDDPDRLPYGAVAKHPEVIGRRTLLRSETDLINEIKSHGAVLGMLVDHLRFHGDALDQRWISIGHDQLQLGLMALTRGVAKPTTF